MPARFAAALVAALLAIQAGGRFRPAYHFSAPASFMNDPNGQVFYQGEYHLFYQHNPFGDTWGHMSWGHAVSPDMLHWRDLPVALPEENGVMIFSGSAVVDRDNTSGLCTGGQGCLVAFYTGHTETQQTQNLAYSNDRGRTWTKYAGNPAIDLKLRNFRDPKVFWYQPAGKWVMVTVLAAEKKVRFFNSTDLKHWTVLSDFGPAGATGGVWECPDLFDLPVENRPGQTRWVLKVDTNPGGAAGGSGGQYFIGVFDGTVFRNDNPPQTVLRPDFGKDFYAATSFSNMPGSRRVWIGWMSNWQYANQEPSSPWRGTDSIPRELALRATGAGLRLVQLPVRELESIRGRHYTGPRQVHTGTFEFEAEVEPGGRGEYGFTLKQGEGSTIIGVGKAEVFIDRRQCCGAPFHKEFSGRHAAPLEKRNGPVKLHVFVDRSSIELFANGGQVVISDRIFLPPGPVSLDANAKVRSFDAWELEPTLMRAASTSPRRIPE